MYTQRPSSRFGATFTTGWQAFVEKLPYLAALAVVPAALIAFTQPLLRDFNDALAGALESLVDALDDPAVTDPEDIEAVVEDGIDMVLEHFPTFAAYTAVAWVVESAFLAFTVRVALAGVDRDPRDFGALARTVWPRLLPFLGWLILASVLTGLGTLLCVLPGLALVSLFSYVELSVLDERPSPLTWSWRAVWKTTAFWPLLGLFAIFFLAGQLVSILVGSLGASVPAPLTVFLVVTASGLVSALYFCVLAAWYRSVPEQAVSDLGALHPETPQAWTPPAQQGTWWAPPPDSAYPQPQQPGHPQPQQQQPGYPPPPPPPQQQPGYPPPPPQQPGPEASPPDDRRES